MKKVSLFFEEEKVEETKSKIAVIKLGSRISVSSVGTSGGTGEALSIIKLLIDAGYHVDAYTKIIKGDILPSDFSIYDIEDEYQNINFKGYKALVIINGNVNYFGGKDVPSQTLNYHIINNFNGKVFYVLCDCKLFLRQIWNSVSSKGFSYQERDINITRDDIVYISQPRKIDDTLSTARKYVNISKCIHFPFEKFPLLSGEYLPFNENPKYDLLYGGTFRGGSRELDMIKFYFGYSNYKVTMFGNIEKNNFNQNKILGLSDPDFEGPVKYSDFIYKMNESRATVIIGDNIYKELDDLAQRIYESLLSGTVVLIDSSYDHNKRVFSNDELVNFCYVYDRSDVERKLFKLQDNSFRKYIVELQRKDVLFDKKQYCNSFRDIIEAD